MNTKSKTTRVKDRMKSVPQSPPSRAGHLGLWHLALALIVAPALSCGEGEGSSALRPGLDETLTCPEGFVGWNFRTHPVSAVTDETSDGTNLVVPFAIDVGEVSCGTRRRGSVSEGTNSDALIVETENALQNTCGGELTCGVDVPAACAAEGAVTVEYRCGLDDRDPDDPNSVRVRTVTLAAGASSRAVRFDCTPAAAEAEVLEERSACIPRNCHGQTRRDENLNCIPDATMPVLDHPTATLTVGASTPLAQPTGSNFFPDGDVFLGGASYPITVDIVVPGTTTDIPENGRVTLWLAREYARFAETGGYAEHREAFRCELGKLEAGRAQVVETTSTNVTVRATGLVQIRPQCIGESGLEQVRRSMRTLWGASEEDAATLVGSGSLWTDASGAIWGNRGTRLHASYDIEGESAVILGDATSETVCSPNPAGFYYNASARAYDMHSYLSQRLIASEQPPARRRNGLTHRGVGDRGGLTWVGPSEFSIGSSDMAMGMGTEGTPSLNVTNQPTRSPTLPVTVGWWGAHGTDPVRYDGRPVSFKARVFIWPSDRAGENADAMPEIGTIELGSRTTREGVNVSRDLPVLANVRQAMYDPTSPLYVDPDVYGNTRSYDVFYCIESEATSGGVLKGWFFGPSSDRNAPSFSVPQRELGSFQGTYVNMRVANRDAVPASSPINSWTNGHKKGCIFAESPLVVTLDRELRNQAVLGNSFYPGAENSERSGDSTMSGTNDADTVSSCAGDNESCRESLAGGMAGSGNMALNYYSYQMDLDHNAGDSEAKSRGSAHILGYMAINPMEEEADIEAPMVGASNPVQITITPPWDTIRTSLAALTSSPPGSLLRREWVRRSYAGAMGLGLGIGFKKRVSLGGIPGELIFTATAGVGLEGTFSLQFAPTEDEAYPGTGQSNFVVQAAAEVAGLEDAAEDCYARGGRLADFRTAAEGAAVRAAVAELDENARYWIGAQSSLSHPTLACLGNGYTAQRCAANMRTRWRWLADDEVAATSIGGARASYTPAGLGTASQVTSTAPASGGLYFNPGTGTVSAAGADTALNYACVFDPAARVDFLKWSIELKLATGAGIALAFCTPSDDPGVCLEGALNFITLSVSPTLSQTNYFLRDGGGDLFSRRSNLNFEIPWALTLLEGAITIKFQASIFSFSYPIVQFDGFKLADGTLLDINAPTHVSFD